jgi:hypothetical protein
MSDEITPSEPATTSPAAGQMKKTYTIKQRLIAGSIFAVGMLAIGIGREVLTKALLTPAPIVLPNRLSCDANAAPAVWEDGQFHVEFGTRTTPPSALFRVPMKWEIARQSWMDGTDWVIAILGEADVQTGNLTPKPYRLRVHPVSALSESVFRINISVDGENNPPIYFTCLGQQH